MDNGALNPSGLLIGIAFAFTGKPFRFNNVCICLSILGLCVCMCTLLWVNSCVCLFMSSSEWFPSESAFYSRIPPGWVWLFDRTAPWWPPVSSLMSIVSNRWSIRALRTIGIRLFVCTFLILLVKKLYLDQDYYFFFSLWGNWIINTIFLGYEISSLRCIVNVKTDS